ncbi:MAG: AI-2E family transporter [Bacilli bacterium]|nr:AI-2E family transporter [Bacilli bacterium]
MFKKVKNKEDLDIEKVNEAINLLDNILKIAYIFIIIVALFFIIKVFKELQIKYLILVILKILAPLFIGLFIAWLFAPMVKKLQKKGIKRSIGTAIVYIVFIGLLALLVGSIIPILRDQINDFIQTLPSIFDSVKEWVSDILSKMSKIDGFNADVVKSNIFTKMEDFSTSITTILPDKAVGLVKTFISGMGSFVVGLIIGFYLLMGFDNAGELLITLLPKKYQKDTRELGDEINNSLRKFINGAIIDAFFVFVITSIAFMLVGLRAPLLFGLFCGITNVIPYAGPYIGGIPAVIVGFAKSPITGILTLISIVVIQFLEGNFMQPVIMSKTTKLHPVTIIVGLLIFGHFLGIIGMVISTPLIAVLKSIVVFFMDKLNIDLFENV